MSESGIDRCFFLKAAGSVALSATGALQPEESRAQFVVPNSAGSEAPRLKAPANACDCHHHIYDALRFPPAQPGGRFLSNARVEEYRLLQRRIGRLETLVVTPRPYAGNNGVTLDAVARLGPNARGVIVVRPDVGGGES